MKTRLNLIILHIFLIIKFIDDSFWFIYLYVIIITLIFGLNTYIIIMIMDFNNFHVVIPMNPDINAYCSTLLKKHF